MSTHNVDVANYKLRITSRKTSVAACTTLWTKAWSCNAANAPAWAMLFIPKHPILAGDTGKIICGQKGDDDPDDGAKAKGAKLSITEAIKVAEKEAGGK